MKKKFVKINAIYDINNLVQLAQNIDGDVFCEQDRYIVNGKSILGVISLQTPAGFWVEYPEDATEFDNFLDTFTVK